MKSTEEIWKTYPEYNFVEASNLGRIRTKDHYVPSKSGSKRLVKGHILKQWLLPCGYMYVMFGVNGKLVSLRVHRVVATCFVPNPLGLPEVNHIDNNPKNNIASNLEWCTSQYNTAYREKYGTPAKEFTKALRKPVIAVNLETFGLLYFESQSEAARQLGADQRHINHVLKGRQNKTHGYWFCYADENAVEKTREKFGDELAGKVEKLIRQNQN